MKSLQNNTSPNRADQVVKLERDDDILDVHSKVGRSAGERVILVVPRGCVAFAAQFGLDLAHRWAAESDIPLALVTTDFGIRERAAASNLPSFSTIARAQSSHWRPAPDANPVVHPTALDDEVPPGPPILERIGLTGSHLLLSVLLFGITAAILAVAAVLLVPSARITIVPAALTVSDSRELILDSTVTTIDQINGIIPATSYRKEISGTASISTTKQDTAPADRASGEVVFTNLTGNPADILPGTIVETSSGVTVRFSTVVTSQLPSGYNARVTVPIQAVDPGPSGNIKPLQINVIEGPLSAVARAINTRATGGGSIKQVHVVSLNDKTLLRDRLTQELHSAAISTLQDDAGSDYFIPPASVQVAVLGESFDHLVDDAAETLTLHLEAVAIGTAVDPADLRSFAQRALADKLPKGYTVLPGTLRVQPDVNARAEADSVILTLNSSEQATPTVDVGKVMKGLSGKSVSEAEKLIASRVSLSGRPRIETNPSWWKLMPYLDFRTAFFVQPRTQANAQ